MPGPVYLSIVEIPGDGVTTQHEFNFAGGYLERAHVKARVTTASGAATDITVVDAMFVNDFTLDLGVAAPVGGVTRIYRDTPRDEPLVDFAGGARLTETNLDTMTRQAILAVAEAFDAGAYAEVNDLLGQAGASASAAEAAAVLAAAAQAAAVEQVALAAAQVAVAAGHAANADASADAAEAFALAINPAQFVLKAGDTMSGHLVVPAGASGTQVPQAQEVALLATTQLGSSRNRLTNGSFEINQRALTSVADDAYFLDRWYILTETGNVTVAQLTDAESGAPFGVRLTQPDASPKRMGFAQIIESRKIRQYASRAMHLAARLRLSTGANIRYAVIEHTGTADSVTSDVVSNWASATFTPSNFFIAGINILRTGTIAPGAAAWGEVSAWGALSAGVKNVIVFVWTESQVAQNVTLDCSRIQYEPGVVATPHEWRMNELALCQRHYFKTFPATIPPAQNAGLSGAFLCPSYAVGGGGATLRFPVEMRGIGAVSTYNPSAANSNWRDTPNGADRAIASASAYSPDSIDLKFSASASGTAYNYIHIAIDVEL